MKFELWYLTLGGLLILAALSSSLVKRLPLTATMFYLAFGILLGPLGFGVATVDPLEHTELVERAAELVVIVSLFTAGLKLRVPLRDERWRLPLRLAFMSMTVTVALITLVGVFGLGLSLGAAVLLGAMLAPTDPVLASDVQLKKATDRDKLRFSLTGEAGMNDGTAFPFLMLGLGLLGLHEIGEWGWRWFAVDVLWATVGGVGIGALLGMLLGRLVLYLRREHKATLGREEFLTLGVIGITYGVALYLQTYGFLAVFAAGTALRRAEQKHIGIKANTQAAGQPEQEGLSEMVLGFNEQLERILEVAMVLVVGLMLTPQLLDLRDFWFVPLLLLVIRPLAACIGVIGTSLHGAQLALIGWFGIRGIGSIYYLAHALGFGIEDDVARRLISISLWVIVTSIVVHGVSVTPLMDLYQKRRKTLPRSNH